MRVDVIIPSLFFLLIGFCFLCGAVLVANRSFRRMKQWITCGGTVVDYVSRENQSRPYFYPKVEFTTTEGKSIVFQSSIGSNGKPYRIGANVKVLYSSENAEDADIRSFTNLWLVPGFLTLFALAFLGVGLSIYLHLF